MLADSSVNSLYSTETDLLNTASIVAFWPGRQLKHTPSLTFLRWLQLKLIAKRISETAVELNKQEIPQAGKCQPSRQASSVYLSTSDVDGPLRAYTYEKVNVNIKT